ncbi:MAG: N-acetylmuramoyl-L-alanine amidase-like domain-containing protein [Candidatus Sericytochromatia bacterium]|nr:N-acetylmuramoyl-L-alanine amidase-like domain-containing protein [Candidatus Sericytochromatia bacterium]
MSRLASLCALLSILALPTTSLAFPAPLPPEQGQWAKLVANLPRETNVGRRTHQVGRALLGQPYLAGSLNTFQPSHQDEPVVARFDGFDCVTLVETALAIARAEDLGERSWSAFKRELERVRYRDGHQRGYVSRLHYFSEWLRDNDRRGIVQDLTASLGGVEDRRPLNFMSTHRAAYRNLASDATFAAIQGVESRLSQQARWVIPKAKLSSVMPLLQSGDIVAFATDIDGLDVVHTGLIERGEDGEVRLLHAPQPGEVVQVSRKNLMDYTSGIARQVGLMVARPLPPARTVQP